MQFHLKFPDVSIAVGEERVVAIPQLLHDRPGTKVIVLDDAFQHRTVKAGLNIVLTDYSNLFTRDWFLLHRRPARREEQLQKGRYTRELPNAGLIFLQKKGRSSWKKYDPCHTSTYFFCHQVWHSLPYSSPE